MMKQSEQRQFLLLWIGLFVYDSVLTIFTSTFWGIYVKLDWLHMWLNSMGILLPKYGIFVTSAISTGIIAYGLLLLKKQSKW